ncbi:hypothetical protein HPP92_013209 [Vanilla planifolia]|uniref:Uncharacterized protein n=1 Tax=Vanilla planifolia TaxID=51239 RepID=A0A835QRV5_VANPL|nr:hypothetical protein HPP92_013209 [Vanilla planifolia]
MHDNNLHLTLLLHTKSSSPSKIPCNRFARNIRSMKGKHQPANAPSQLLTKSYILYKPKANLFSSVTESLDACKTITFTLLFFSTPKAAHQARYLVTGAHALIVTFPSAWSST